MKPNYEAALAHSLERSANMDGRQISWVLVKFKLAAAKTNEETAFRSAIESWSNETPERALTFFEHLQKMETENKFTIPTSLERVTKHAKTLKENYNKLECAIVLSDEEKKYMPKHQRDAFERCERERLAGPRAQTEIPSCFFQSNATWQNRPVNMILEIVQR